MRGGKELEYLEQGSEGGKELEYLEQRRLP